MKILFILALIIPFSSFAIVGSDLELHGYMRVGTGTNGKGGDQVCFSQSGVPGNEFRLGNECDNYGELKFTFKHLKSSDGKSGFFNSHFMLAYGADGHTNWEAPGIAIRQAYVDGGRFNNSTLTFWAGRRFYRENDLHMNDFYYFADTNGIGAGIGDIKLFGGNLHLAQLKETNTDETSESSSGKHAVTLWDARLKDIKIGPKEKLMFWAGYATSPDGDGVNGDSNTYDSSSGFVFGILHDYSLARGFNHFAILRGSGLLDEFSLFGSSYEIKGSASHQAQKNSNRLRVVEHLTTKIGSKWEFHFGATYELRDNGNVINNKSTWYNVGVRPVYFFSDHYHLATEIGHSVVDEDGAEKRNLTRISIAPEVSLGGSIWSRPVIRAFYAKSFWNKANRGIVGNSVETYKNEASGSSYGFQAEVFF